MRNINELPECPVATTISLVGNKWKLLIIRNLTKRTWRFNELQKSLNGISQKVLTDSLRQLERDGIIFRKDYHTNPPKVEYGMTDLGLELSKMLDVSDSYLKKVTRQLVVAGLITSKASKLGGFILNKKMNDISFLDIFEAIEGKEKFIETTHLVDKVFDPALNIQHTEDIIINHLDAAENQYKQKLKEINLGEITNYVHQNSI